METPEFLEEKRDDVFFLTQRDNVNGDIIERKIRRNQISLERLAMMFDVSIEI
jgi:hypothetical protein